MKKRGLICLSALALVMSLLLCSCSLDLGNSGFVSKSEYDDLVAKVAALENRSVDPSDMTNNTYNISVSPADGAENLTAAKALLSAVSVLCNFERSYSMFGSPQVYTKNYSSAGSGVIYRLDKEAGDAIVITNFHVVYDYDSNEKDGVSRDISLYLYGQELPQYKIPATFVGGSVLYDIAVLRVSGSPVLQKSAAVAAEFADSDDTAVGQIAVAVGNPEATGLSATYGHVNVDSEYIQMSASDNSGYLKMRVVRTDAAVNSGNSGGGLFNSVGKLIGIVNAKMAVSDVDNIGYAIPSNVAKAITENILYYNGVNADNHSVFRCLLGIEIGVSASGSVYDEENGTLGIRENVIVTKVSEDGHAVGKLEVNDLVKSIEIGGTEYKINRMFHIMDTMLNVRVGDRVVFRVMRGGVETEVTFDITEAMLTKSK